MTIQTTPAEQLVDAILACVQDYGLMAPSIDKDKAILLAQKALDNYADEAVENARPHYDP